MVSRIDSTTAITSEPTSRVRPVNLKSGGSGYVFLSSQGTPYKRHDSLNRAFARACWLSVVRSLRFHDLRHTSATRMIEKCVSIVAVNKILGHADLKTTMRYAHPDDSLKDAVEKLANLKKNNVQATFS
ncbi:MAG: tyrosine-type recombinase/integrase [Thermodesulfobacteriota bacterium]